MRILCSLLFSLGLFNSCLSQIQATEKQSYVALVDECFNENELKGKGIEIGSRIDNIVTLRTTNKQSKIPNPYPGIVYLQKANRIKPDLVRVLPDMKVDSVHGKNELKQAYTGKDVIIGITDWGFDYTHPQFYDTSLKHTRILAAWDQFKTSGPHPSGYNYGTEYEGENELLAAKSDTFNIYQYATHGSHVAGIAGGSGGGTVHRGVAFDANFLFVTFLVDEAAVLDAFAWMKKKADFYHKPLVINMSWGLYHFGTLDGTSIFSRAIDNYSKNGVVFVTSAGNNGDEVFHIKKEFNKDTFRSQVRFYPYAAHPSMWGQSISMWGEKNQTFDASFEVYTSSKAKLANSPIFKTLGNQKSSDSFLVLNTDTVFYKTETVESHSLNQRPHIRLRIKNTNTSLQIALKSSAKSGIVHYWNVVELTNDVGNWGMPFSAWQTGWLAGDNKYGIGEPACTRSAISIAAHSSEFKAPGGNTVGGQIANFSSIGPTMDGRVKPDLSAPGVNVASSISSFTTRPYTLLENVMFKGRNYPYSRFSGTSMSSPATAGVVALMLQANPDLSADKIKSILKETARQDNRTGIISDSGSTTWGWGKVNAYAAVSLAEQSKESAAENLDKIFPNPSQSQIYYSGENGKLYNAKIYNQTGMKIAEDKIGLRSGFDISKIASGLYYVAIENEGFKIFKLQVR